MNQFARHTPVVLGCLLAVMLLAGCAASFEPQPFDPSAETSQLHTASHDDITVSATILQDDQALQEYGVDLAGVGLQAIWLRIDNRRAHSRWLLVSALDPNYYAPDEAAVLFHSGLNDEEEERLVQHFRSLAIPLKTPAGAVTEGYVLAPRQEGGRYVIVSLAGRTRVQDFGFAITLPDGDFDFERLQPENIYADRELPDLDRDRLRWELQYLPCCAKNAGSDRDGDPLNLVVVGNLNEVLASMSRAGWSFTHRIGPRTVQRMIGAALTGAEYKVAPVSPLYFFGRPQDMALQRARNTIVQRNHLRLWLAPFRHDGKSVWVGQISRDIGVKATTKSSTLTTHVIDPNVDEAREHLLQSLLVAEVVQRFAFVGGIEPATVGTPHRNLTEDPYFTDGLRLVVMLSADGTVPLEDVEFIEWRNSADPMRRGRNSDEPTGTDSR